MSCCAGWDGRGGEGRGGEGRGEERRGGEIESVQWGVVVRTFLFVGSVDFGGARILMFFI